MTGTAPTPRFVHLYDGLKPSEADVRELASSLGGIVPRTSVDVREDFFQYWLTRTDAGDAPAEALARELARIRVRRPERREFVDAPLAGEVDFERRFLLAGGRKPAGIPYDGDCLSTAMAALLSPDEVSVEHCHVALTCQFFVTWDRDDLRYHARAAMYGFPSLISTLGLVEAPAKPRDYYLGRMAGVGARDPDPHDPDRYLQRSDTRLQDVIKGYLLQALFFHATGDPFCANKDCCLYNAHWQEELIHAQLRPGAGLCAEHARVLEGMA